MGGTAVIPIEGVIGKKMNLFMDISGGTSTQLLSLAVNQALEDPAVHSILLYVDSPGGAVDGTQEAARMIYDARGQKPIVAYTDGLMASAAYWLGAAADRVYISGDTVEVGSIGVVASHTDYSEREKATGVKTTEIVAGKFKRVTSSHAPLSDIGRATIQEQVDHIYSVFVSDVATFRGTTPENVVKDMADGRIFLGRQAIDRGLVDGQRSLAQVLGELATSPHTGGRRMSSTAPQPTKETGISQADHDAQVTEAIERGRLAGVVEGHKKGHEEGILVGRAAELARVKAVQAQFLPGHQALIQTLMFDGTTDGPAAAVLVLQAERKNKETKLEEFFADAPKPVDAALVPADLGPTSEEAKRTKLIQDIQARESISYQDAAMKAAKEQPALFKNR
jgi:signal peptide peptidase SppA